MTVAQLVPVLLQVSVGLVVLAVGLQAAPGDLIYLLRRPSLLLRSVLAMNVITPLVAAGIAAGLKLKPEIETALILLAVAPVPPVLPNKQIKAGGNESYAVGLLALSAALAIVAAPLTVMAIGRWFGYTVAVAPALIARVVGVSVLGPLLVGALVRGIAPGPAASLAKPLSGIGSVLLAIAAVLLLLGMWRGLSGALGQFTVPAVAAFVLVSLGVGHVLGGPDADDRTVLALSTASRHPGVALAIAGAVAEDKQAVSAAVLLAFLVGMVVTAPYTKWRKRTSPAAR